MGCGDGGGNRREGHARLGVNHDGIEAVLGDSRLDSASQRVLIDLVALKVPFVGDIGKIEIAGDGRLPILGANHLNALEEAGAAACAFRDAIRLDSPEGALGIHVHSQDLKAAAPKPIGDGICGSRLTDASLLIGEHDHRGEIRHGDSFQLKLKTI